MKKIIYQLLYLVILFCISDIAISEQAIIRGMGAYTCGEYTMRSKDNSAYQTEVTSWGFGYISGLNAVLVIKKHKYRNIPSAATVIAYVDKYCSDHPLKRVVEAYSMLFDELEYRSYDPDDKQDKSK